MQIYAITLLIPYRELRKAIRTIQGFQFLKKIELSGKPPLYGNVFVSEKIVLFRSDDTINTDSQIAVIFKLLNFF